MRTRKSASYSFLLLTGIIFVINILANRFFHRFDFTEDNRFTLSRATKDILTSLENPVTITAYFSEDLPPNIEKARRDFKELLVEYNNISKGMVLYEFINPNEDEAIEQKAMRSGIQPVIVNIREKDNIKQQKAYLGALLQLDEQQEVIPFMKPGSGMEYALSSGIKKLSVTDKPVIGLLQGHGEPGIEEITQAYTSLSVLYDVRTITFNDTIPLSGTYKTIAIVAPKDTFPQSHLQQLSDYLRKGGNLFIAYDRVTGNFQTAQGTSVYTGLETWLSQFGVDIDENFVVDWKCGSVMVKQQQGMFNYQTQVPFHYFPSIINFEDHPVTKGLENVLFQFASSITFTGDSAIKFVPLLKSSENAGTLRPPLYFNIQKQWSTADFPLSNITLGAVISGKLIGENNSRIIVLSDGDFPVSGKGRNSGQIQPDNVNLMVNSIDWLSDDTGLIGLRTRGVSSRPLDELEDGTKTLLKYFNFLLPIILVMVYGFLRIQINRNTRIKRMEEKYV